MLYFGCKMSSGGKKMIYDSLNELDERVENYGVSLLSYVALNCAR